MEGMYPSLADIRAATHDNNDDDRGFGGMGDFLILILLFILLAGGGNMWGGNRDGAGNTPALATQADVQRGFDTQTLISKIDQQTYGLADSTFALNNSIKDGFYATQSALDNCCCTTQRAIDSVKFDMAQGFAATNANTTAAMQKVVDTLNENKIEALQGQISQLQLQAAMCGVVRYPTATTYTAPSPYFMPNPAFAGTAF